MHIINSISIRNKMICFSWKSFQFVYNDNDKKNAKAKKYDITSILQINIFRRNCVTFNEIKF